jgi:inosine-uridine nucleoside N-ribohydrolase
VRRRARNIVVAASAVLPLLAACGGGDDGAATSAASIPTTSIAQATSIAQPAAAAGLPLVIDTDLAADDLVALSYVTSLPEVDLLAVTVSGTGEVRCPRGADVARGLLARMGRDEVRVACGSSTPVAGSRTFPEPWRDSADNAYGLLLEVVTPPADQPTAAELLADAITSSPQPVVLLTLGPLTNVAEAIANDPGLLTNVARIVVMGGAVDVPGNVQPDGAAEPLAVEWNLYVDPAAAAAVIGSGTPVTLVGLDATNHVPVTEDLIDRLAANDTTDATRRVLQLFEVHPPPYLWDPLAAIAATDPALVPTHAAEITVVSEGDDAGRTVASTGGSRIDVAGAPDAGAVIDHLLRSLSGVQEGDQLATPTTLPVLGEVTVDFDGTTCSYGGPPTLPAGAYEVSTAAGPTEYVAAVVHLVAGATVDEVLAWVAEHPDEEPPMVDDIGVVGGWGEPSPAAIVFRTGTVAIACGTEDGAVHVAGTVDVSG